MTTFNVRLKELRKSRHLSQRELAEKLHISKSAISMYEGGQREPDHGTLEIIADFFNVDMDYLLGRKNTTHRIMEINPNRIDYSLQISTEDRQLLDAIISLSTERKETVAQLVKFLAE